MNRVLHTKFGNAKIDDRGYYRITSRKEGNYRKFLHRLIWEDYYGFKIPKRYSIHHKNRNKTDNCILNLQLIRESDHMSLHNSGKTVSDKTKQKIIEGNIKPYATIIKTGKDKGKQRFALMFNGKRLKRSINKEKLLKWFLKEYPLEIIQIMNN